MKGRLGDKARLNHILDAITEIELYVSNVSSEYFLSNSMIKFACIKQLEIIGEASNYVSEEIKTQFPDIAWTQIKGMRNVFIHEYFGIDSLIVWDIIINDLPDLKRKIKNILDTLA